MSNQLRLFMMGASVILRIWALKIKRLIYFPRGNELRVISVLSGLIFSLFLAILPANADVFSTLEGSLKSDIITAIGLIVLIIGITNIMRQHIAGALILIGVAIIVILAGATNFIPAIANHIAGSGGLNSDPSLGNAAAGGTP